MRQVNRRRAMFAAIATVTLLIGGTVGAVAASQHFAYQKIRSGLPSGLPKLDGDEHRPHRTPPDPATVLGLHRRRRLTTDLLVGSTGVDPELCDLHVRP